MDPNIFSPEIQSWGVLRTAAQWEKKLASLLVDIEVPVYLPLMVRRTQYRGKRRSVDVPIFSGYVFCSLTHFLQAEHAGPTIKSKVAQLLQPPDGNLLYKELSTISELLNGGRQLVQERTIGGVGDIVRITGGALTGYSGPILRMDPKKWFVVIEVSFLGTRLEAEVDARLISPVKQGITEK